MLGFGSANPSQSIKEQLNQTRHTRESGYPVFLAAYWIPALFPYQDAGETGGKAPPKADPDDDKQTPPEEGR